MILERNEAAHALLDSTPRLGNESNGAYARRLSILSGGATSPAAFRRMIQRKVTGYGSASNRIKREVAKAGKVMTDEKKDDLVWAYDGPEKITNLQEALVFSKVDLNTWEVDRHVFNSWPTTAKGPDGKLIQQSNIQVKIWFKRRRDHGIDWDQVIEAVADAIKERKTIKHKGTGIGFICTADFHLGAYVDDLIRSEKFNIDVLVEYLCKTADIINSKGYKEVHVAMLGDFIESFTGLNHANSWKGLGKGMFGVNAVILCNEVLVDSFLSRINNLKKCYLVSGNHDRVTSEKEIDQKGEIGQLLAYMLERSMPEVGFGYHPMVLNPVVDGISYVLTHGHLPFSNRELAKILFDYGRQGMFNVLLKGHLHSRETKKTYKGKSMIWNDQVVVQMDEVDYRVLTAPAMFTGNFFSESLGFSSSAGFLEIQNNGKGKINVFDYSL